MGYMTYSFLTIKREENGHQVVGRPRETDVIGHSLRNAFDASYGLPEDMTAMLRRLDGVGSRLH